MGKHLESSVIISVATKKGYFLSELGKLVKSFVVTLELYWHGKKTIKIIHLRDRTQHDSRS